MKSLSVYVLSFKSKVNEAKETVTFYSQYPYDKSLQTVDDIVNRNPVIFFILKNSTENILK